MNKLNKIFFEYQKKSNNLVHILVTIFEKVYKEFLCSHEYDLNLNTILF